MTQVSLEGKTLLGEWSEVFRKSMARGSCVISLFQNHLTRWAELGIELCKSASTLVLRPKGRGVGEIGAKVESATYCTWTARSQIKKVNPSEKVGPREKMKK